MDISTHRTALRMQSTAQALTANPDSWDADIDYLTAYWSLDEREAFPEAKLIGYINGQINAGHREQRRSSHGIEWWGAGGAALGVRDGERYYRASGQCAAEVFRTCAGSARHFSRLDGRLDCCYAQAQERRGRAAYEGFQRLPRAAGQPRSAKLVQDTDRGETLYIGSRQSDVFLRFYDAGIAHETHRAGCRWRYEVELKGSRATDAAALLYKATSQELATAALVRTAFTDRRVTCPVLLEDLRCKVRSRETTDLDRRLDWLAGQVAPSVARLVADGYIEAALEALGLGQLVEVIPQH